MSNVRSSRRERRRYAPKGAMDRAVEAVRANFIRRTSVTVMPDGSIKLSSAEEGKPRGGRVFNALDKAGRP